jgi:cation diffusion facilitator family transporter
MENNYRVLLVATVTNIFLGVVKLVAGIFLFSTALISEAVDSLMDVLNNLVAIFAVNRSHQPADEEHPFGHGKYEYFGSLVLGIIIVIVGGNLILGFAEGTENIPLLEAIYVLVGATIIKFFLARYLKTKGKVLDNELIYALGVENQSDIYKSAVVFLGIILSIFTNFTIFGLTFDNIAAIFIGIYIVKTGIVILLESRDNILGQSASSEIYQEVKGIVEDTEKVLGVTDLKIIKFGPYFQVLVSIIVDASLPVEEGHNIASHVKQNIMKRNDISYVLVHVDPSLK